MVKFYGRTDTLKFLPKTYVPKIDKKLIIKEFNRTKLYFLKNNKQRQEGIYLTNKLTDILNLEKKGYLLAQECLGKPFTYRNHKVHFRVYFSIIHKKGDIECYLYDDGLVGYSKDKITSTKSIEDKTILGCGSSKELYTKGFPVLIS